MSSTVPAARVATALPASGVIVAWLLLVSEPAGAHPGHPSEGLGVGSGLLHGMSHVLTGADHLLAVLGVGLLAALMATRGMAWHVSAAFVGGVLVGCAAGLLVPGAPVVGALLSGTVVMVGGLLVGAPRPDGLLLPGILVAVGVLHGHAHTATASLTPDAAAYLLGILVATAALHLSGALVGSALRGRGSYRSALGAVIAAAGGVLVLAG